MTTVRYPPDREADLVEKSLVFKTKIALSPTTYSLTAAQATNYGTLHDDFVAKRLVCQDEMTKSKGNTAIKNAAKKALVAELRLLAGIVKRSPACTNEMLIELGMPPRDEIYSPIPVPEHPPELKVESVYGHDIHLIIQDATGQRKGKPWGVAGASVYSHIGETAPTTGAEGWVSEGITTRRKVHVKVADSVPAGTKIWFTAFYYNPRGQSSVACTPVPAVVGIEGASPLAA